AKGVGGTQAAGGPLPGAELGGPSERMRAERGGLRSRTAARQERADEAREQVPRSAGGESWVPARHDVHGTPQVRDYGGHAFQEDGGLHLLCGFDGGAPAVVRRLVGELVAELCSELAQV